MRHRQSVQQKTKKLNSSNRRRKKTNKDNNRKPKGTSRSDRESSEAGNQNGSQEANVVCSTEEETYWEVDKIVGRRVFKGRVEYRVRWKGCDDSQNTWEPTSNLCDTAMAEAIKFTKALNSLNKQSEEVEKKLLAESGQDEREDPLPKRQKTHDNGSDKQQGGLRGDEETQNKHNTNGTKDLNNVFPVQDTAKVQYVPGQGDGRWLWTDEEQLQFREIERLHIGEKDVRQRVSEARLNGTPIVLVGHEGWAGFATRWLCPTRNIDRPNPKKTGVSSKAVSTESPTGVSNDKTSPLVETTGSAEPILKEGCSGALDSGTIDPTPELTAKDLDIDRMVEDIGVELVPVVRKDYNEEDPIHAKILASRFLHHHWIPKSKGGEKRSLLYLHQWQFPLSDGVGRKLCHQSKSLPNDILGEDLLQYWLDLPQCKGDNPLQYLFMGGAETMSKLHRDCGGLDITIAPIVGEKECVLVHRSDGPSCLYHLQADIDKVDLDSFPLMAHARVWKSTIKPGEILLMPQGTYHQCRNITPCLSYSRFHLDTLNLLPFLQSMSDEDAPEIDHGDVLWNCATELIRKLDAYTDESRRVSKSKRDLGLADWCTPLDEDTARLVNTLRTIRNACKEVARRIASMTSSDCRDGPGSHVTDFARLELNSKSPALSFSVASERVGSKGLSEEKSLEVAPSLPFSSDEDQSTDLLRDWAMMVDDIDVCLHEFRFRNDEKIPPIRLKPLKLQGEMTSRFFDTPQRKLGSDSGSSTQDSGGETNDEAVGGVSQSTSAQITFRDGGAGFSAAFRALPKAKDEEKGGLLGLNWQSVQAGVEVFVNLNGRRVRGSVIRCKKGCSAAYLTYEGYPSEYNEFQPYERLRVPIGGEGAAMILPDHVRPGIVVLNRWGSHSEVSVLSSILLGAAAADPFVVVVVVVGVVHLSVATFQFECVLYTCACLGSTLSYRETLSPNECPFVLLWCQNEQEYRARVQSTTVQPFFFVSITVGGETIERWIPLDKVFSIA